MYSRYNINRNRKATNFKRHNILNVNLHGFNKGLDIKKYALDMQPLLVVAVKSSRIFPATVY
jgi:hypothetical protein